MDERNEKRTARKETAYCPECGLRLAPEEVEDGICAFCSDNWSKKEDHNG